MARAATTRNIFDKKHETFDITGIWEKVFGLMSKFGILIIYGKEKHGKTTFALMLAKMLSKLEKVMYVSAEEGTDLEFVEACKRAGITANDKNILWLEYTPLEEIEEKMNKRKAPRIWFIDNATIYDDEFRGGEFLRFKKRHPDKYIVILAHEERGEPYPACAKAVKRLAKIVVRVQGLACFVSGRCPGGTLTINEKTAQLYHGSEILKQPEPCQG